MPVADLVDPVTFDLQSGRIVGVRRIGDKDRTGPESRSGFGRDSRREHGQEEHETSSGFPDDGLALNVVLHKFYPSKPVGRAAIGAVEWNRDFAWFKAEEAAQLLPPNPTRGGRLPRRAERSFKAELLGHATYDLKRKRFTKFELVALGVQQGGGERSSPDPVPIGVALTLVGDSPVERVEPFHLDLYGWD